MNLRTLLTDVRTAATMPRVDIVLSRGRPHEEELLRQFRRRHPRYKIVRAKSIGVALLPIHNLADYDAYLAAREDGLSTHDALESIGQPGDATSTRPLDLSREQAQAASND